MSNTAAPNTKARLAELRQLAEKRLQAAKEGAELRELQELELVEKYLQELGPRGVDFEMVSTPADGPIVIKRIEEVAYKKFKSAIDSAKGASHEDYYDYATPGVVFPDRTTFDVIVSKRPHVVVRLANAMLTLHGAKEASDAGKF